MYRPKDEMQHKVCIHTTKTEKISDKLLLAKNITSGEIPMTSRRQGDNNKHLSTVPAVLVTSFQLYYWNSSCRCLLLFLAVTPDIKISIHSKIIAFVKSCKWNAEAAYVRVSHSHTDSSTGVHPLFAQAREAAAAVETTPHYTQTEKREKNQF